MSVLVVLGCVVLALVVAAFVARHFVRSGGRLAGLPIADLSHGTHLRGRTVVVTGATSGIGFEVAHGLAACGAHVVMACITQREGDAARDRLLARNTAHSLEVQVVDLRDAASIDAFVGRLRGRPLQQFVHCAGVCGDVPTMVHVNFLGAARLTLRLLDQLHGDRVRVVCVGSDSHQIGHVDMADLTLERRFGDVKPALAAFGRVMQAYGTTKLSFILWLLELSQQAAVARRRIAFAIVQPGFVDTPMGEEALRPGSLAHRLLRRLKAFFAKTPWQGAQTVLHVCTHPSVDAFAGGPVRAWANNALWRFWNPQTESVGLRRQLWTATAPLVGCSTPNALL